MWVSIYYHSQESKHWHSRGVPDKRLQWAMKRSLGSVLRTSLSTLPRDAAPSAQSEPRCGGWQWQQAEQAEETCGGAGSGGVLSSKPVLFVLLFEIESGLQLGSQEVPWPSDPPAPAGIMYNHTQFHMCWEWSLGTLACWASTLQLGLPPSPGVSDFVT